MDSERIIVIDTVPNREMMGPELFTQGAFVKTQTQATQTQAHRQTQTKVVTCMQRAA